MQLRDETILKKIDSEITVALDILGNASRNEFNSNEIMKRAICMTVINIGELVKNLTTETRQQYPHIPWRSISGFRDIAAHKYQTLKMDDVYFTVRNDFPELKCEIQKIIA